jgi:hypothetical protein
MPAEEDKAAARRFVCSEAKKRSVLSRFACRSQELPPWINLRLSPWNVVMLRG